MVIWYLTLPLPVLHGYFLMGQRYTTKLHLYKFSVTELRCVASLWLENLCRVQDSQRLLRRSVPKGNFIYRAVVAPLISGLQKPLKQSLGLFQPPSTVHEEVRQRSPRRDGTFWWLFRVAKLGYCSVFSFAGALTLSSPTTEGSYNDRASH